MIKKLMSKKANIFGKKVSVFMITLIAVIGVAAAALVPYLSNVITGNVVVESPLEFSDVSVVGVGACSSSGSTITCNSLPIHGGESFSVTETAKNKGTISSPEFYTVIAVSNLADPTGLTLGYTTESFTNQAPVGQKTVGDITYYYYGYADGNVWPAPYTETGTMTFTTAPNFKPDTYGITVGTVLKSEVHGVTMNGYCRVGTPCTVTLA